MALPAIAAAIGTGLVAGLAQFLTTRAGMILAGLGLTFIGVKGFQTFLGYVITDIQTVAAFLAAGSGSAMSLGQKMLQFAAFAGFFEGLNIIISGYFAYASLLGVRFILGRLQ